jgi:hypothetical protein
MNTEEIIYKNIFKNIVILTSIFVFLYALLIYIVDPLQQFRAAKFYQPVYIDEAYQNPGLARHYTYDTVIVGSSTSENFKPSYIHQQLGWNAIKLTLFWISAREARIMLDMAIATGKVKNVLLGLDDFSFQYDHLRTDFPTYLYQQNMANSAKYLLNLGNIRFIFKSFFGKAMHDHRLGLDGAYSWDHEAEYSAERVKKNWVNEQKAVSGNSSVSKTLSYENMVKNFDRYIFPVLTSHPEINFHFYYPPYSILFYKKLLLTNDFWDYVRFKKYVFYKTRKLSNVKLYDFQTETKITAELNNYKDLTHFSGKISNYIIANLNNKKYLITEKNMNIYPTGISMLSRQELTT